ncbi:MAG TPA: MbnP family protein [Bacteroidia bacterium]|nr:MbnP family protein [Bacteroidia bacterium]
MRVFKYFLLLILLFVTIISCTKDKPIDDGDDGPNTSAYGAVTIKFENKVGSNPLILDFKDYINLNGDSFRVSMFNYYISNVKLFATDNSVFIEKESYHLVSAGDVNSMQFTIANVPAKSYSSISFLIGVDSLRNTSGAQTGALDPGNGHFWSWNSGYIMTKFEGTSPKSNAVANVVLFHVGGFSGSNSVLKTVLLPLTSNATVSAKIIPQIFLKADLAEWFSPNPVDFSKLNTIHMPGIDAKKMADNYANMFSITQVLN